VEEFPDSDIPPTDEKSWFYRAITYRCGGKTSFNSMKEYVTLWKYDKHIEERGSPIITLDYLKNEAAAAKPAAAKAASAATFKMLPVCSHRNYPSLTVKVATTDDAFLSYCSAMGYLAFGQHNPTTDGESSCSQNHFCNVF
jgi:hypothetical protein